MKISRTATLFLVTALASAAVTRAGEPALGLPSEQLLQRFTVAKGGDILLIPVRFLGKDRLFIVDTGFGKSAFDSSLPLGEPRGVVMVQSPQGLSKVKIYDPPVASVGDLPFVVNRGVCSFDMKELREAVGRPIEGVLGMDFLGRFVIRIDFDKGELLFLNAVPKDSGVPISIARPPGETPTILAELTGGETVRFIVDTGAVTYNSGVLESSKMRELVRKGEFSEIGKVEHGVFNDTFSSRLYRGKRLRLGEFTVTGPIFSDVPQTSNLGLGFWSRFKVTFDFPGNKVYLRKGESYERPEFRNTSGLHFVEEGSALIIDSVDEGSPGAKAGVRAGDVLVEFEGQRVGEASLLALWSALCKGKRLSCVLRRGKQEHHVTVDAAPEASPGPKTKDHVP